MTDTLQDLVRRIESATELHSITRTMRGLAAVNLRHHEIANSATDAYEAIIEDGLQVALREGRIERLPVDTADEHVPTALFVFGSNQGLCGPVNRHVITRVLEEAAGITQLVRVGAVGARMAAELDLVGRTADAQWDLPATIEAIPLRAEQLLDQADRWRNEKGIGRFLLVFPHYLGRNQGYSPITLQLLPTDRDWLEWLAIRRWPSRVIPVYDMAWNELVGDLIRQALFVRLHRSFAQTMASVSVSRLTAMDAAQRTIEERLTNLHRQHHQLRHSEITKELLDVTSGFELLSQE